LASGIKAAADSSNPSVLVAPGTYCETVLIEASVDIAREGEEDVVVVGQGCHTVSVVAGTVKLKGITVQSTGTGPWSAIYAGGSVSLALESCTLQSLRGPAFVTASSAPCSASSKTTFSSNLGSGALVVNKASFAANDCVFSNCALNGVEARDASTATITASEIMNCRQSGVLSCDEGSCITCNACTMTNCLASGVRAEAFGSVTLDKCNVVRNQGNGCSSLDGGIITATAGAINSNAGHGVMVHAAALTLSAVHVDFNARHGVVAAQQSTVSLESVQLVNNSQKGLMLSPRTKEGVSEKEVVAKDVWWPMPNCGPKEVYVD
jgi:hypothetical protein